MFSVRASARMLPITERPRSVPKAETRPTNPTLREIALLEIKPQASARVVLRRGERELPQSTQDQLLPEPLMQVQVVLGRYEQLCPTVEHGVPLDGAVEGHTRGAHLPLVELQA
jgi:hypothetical protein